MKYSKTLSMIIAGVTMGLISSGAAIADGSTQTSAMHNFADQSVIANTEATLVRLEGGVHIKIDTVGLTPGHAVTAWFVVFNSPEKCSGGACGEDDIFILDSDGKFVLNADGSPPMNMDGVKAANISVHRAAGIIIDDGGSAVFMGSLVIGDVSEAIFGGGLLDTHVAEVHIVIRDHQEAISGSANQMVNSINGGCAKDFPNVPCEDLQFAVFKPSS